MGAQTTRYENDYDDHPKKPERRYFCDHCHGWMECRDLDKPPRRCPSCKRPWDHQRRWFIRMENSPAGAPGGRVHWPWAENHSLGNLVSRMITVLYRCWKRGQDD